MKENKSLRVLLLIGVVLIWVLFAMLATSYAAELKPSEILDCKHPQGYEYICYSDDECKEYLSGYSGVLSEKIYTEKDPHPIVWMNLYYEHTGLLLLGKIEGEIRNGKWYLKMWQAIYNDQTCTLIHEQYHEGYREKKE